MKTIAITGASGFVGTNLSKYFSQLDYHILSISREDLQKRENLQDIINASDIVINLAGANILKRWSKEYKKMLYSSRIETTKNIVQAIQSSNTPPELFISTSAIGIYDNKNTYDENGEFANDFLSKLCQDWEKEALKARSVKTKVAIFRFSVVLGRDGGAFKQMITPFKLGLGGIIADGKQAFSFIHVKDLLDAYRFVIENKCDGVFNLSSPNPCTNEELTKTLGKVLHRPTFLPLPEFVLRLIFGEGAKILSDGQKVLPKHLEKLGFNFKYKTIEECVKNLCEKRM